MRVITANGDDLTETDDHMKVAMRQIAGAFSQLEKTRLVAKLRPPATVSARPMANAPRFHIGGNRRGAPSHQPRRQRRAPQARPDSPNFRRPE
jgi:hypothetical protein